MTNISVLREQKERLEAELKLYRDGKLSFNRFCEIGRLLNGIDTEIQEAEREAKKRQCQLFP